MTSLVRLLRRSRLAGDELFELIAGVRRLRKQKSLVVFTAEGGISIALPDVGYSDLLSAKRRKLVSQSISYASRPHAESLMRSTVFNLLHSGYIDPRRSMIDIGSWIGDNAVVWAAMLRDGGTVFAIDPSEGNLDFGKAVAELNGLTNIRWVRAVCADHAGLDVCLDGTLDHAQFTVAAANSSRDFVTATLDAVVPESAHTAISLLHVDVEGFEQRVLFGARSIIKASRPVIIFEQHISKEDPGEIVRFLTNNGYAVFMINEVLPGCDLDCRNFIALDSARPLPQFPEPQHSHGRHNRVWYAALGPALLRVN